MSAASWKRTYWDDLSIEGRQGFVVTDFPNNFFWEIKLQRDTITFREFRQLADLRRAYAIGHE